MLPLGTLIRSLAPGQWMVARTPDSKPAVIVTLAESSDADVVWSQLDRWCAALHATNEPGIAVPVRLRLPDATPRLAYSMIPWRVGVDGLATSTGAAHIIDVLKGIAQTLDALHGRGITHGALGMPSLWWESPERVVLPDVGLAHVLDGLIEAPPNSAAYHAPEIWRGASPTPASDQFAFAVIALELLTGRERNPVSEVEGIVAFEPIVLDAHSAVFKGAASGMYDVFQRALAAAPTSRFVSCTEFVEALAGHLEPVASLRTVHPALQQIRKRVTARGIGFTAVAALVLTSAFLLTRRPVSTARIADSVSARIQDLGQVETILPGQQNSTGDLRSSVSNLRRDIAAGQAGGPSSTGSSDAATGTSSSAAAAGNDATADARNQNASSPTRTVTRSNNLPQLPVNAAIDSLGARAPDSVVERGRGERFALAVSEAVRTATGAGRTQLSPEEAQVSAALARSGVIRLDVPRGSRVYLDGVLQNGTPIVLTAIAGPHDVDVLLPGATQPQRRRVTVIAADTTVLRIARND